MGDALKDQLIDGLTRVCARAGLDGPVGLTRLTGGATMESWRFEAVVLDPSVIWGNPTTVKGETLAFVLRRAPSLEFMDNRPFGHGTEAAVIRAAKAAEVTAPVVVAELQPEDGIGSGFVMEALPGTPNPKEILEFEGADELLKQAARDLARIHSLKPGDVPADVPVMDYRAEIARLREQFEEAGGDRPIIALGLRWMEDNCPDPCEPVLIHGDYRMGNLLAEPGNLTGVLDWELAHFGDPHEDLAFGCMAVWRFHRYDRPALGLGSLEDYFAAYEAESGRKVDRKRFRYWLIHRTVWWALGCLNMARIWRSGEDRMLERVVISRRTSEQELDLLMLLEEDAPEEEREPICHLPFVETPYGEASDGELAQAVIEWLETIKPQMTGHNRFQHAVARNALGMIARGEDFIWTDPCDEDTARELLSGEVTLADAMVLMNLRQHALEKLSTDVPRYPALAVARERWLEPED